MWQVARAQFDKSKSACAPVVGTGGEQTADGLVDYLAAPPRHAEAAEDLPLYQEILNELDSQPVYYTHLTLPTKRIV